MRWLLVRLLSWLESLDRLSWRLRQAAARALVKIPGRKTFGPRSEAQPSERGQPQTWMPERETSPELPMARWHCQTCNLTRLTTRQIRESEPMRCEVCKGPMVARPTLSPPK